MPEPVFVLRRVRRPDAALLEQLAAYDEEAFGPTGLRIYDLAVAAEAGAVFTLSRGDVLVGGCQLLRLLDEPSFLYLVGFYLLPGFRGLELGSRFLQLLAQECRGLGAEGLVLTVSPRNTAAKRLYRRAGFVQEAFVTDFYGPGEDRLLLRWRFEQSGLQGGVS